jgi:hypothetical protein
MRGKQLTKEQITKRLQESQDRYLRRYCEESRQELYESLRAKRQKEAEIVTSDKLLVTSE